MFSVNRCIHLFLPNQWPSCDYLFLAGGVVLKMFAVCRSSDVFIECASFVVVWVISFPLPEFFICFPVTAILAVLFGVGSLLYYPPIYFVLKFHFSFLVSFYLVGLFFLWVWIFWFWGYLGLAVLGWELRGWGLPCGLSFWHYIISER